MLGDGTHSVRFRLYDSPDPAVTTPLYEETVDVSVAGGYFTVYLGDTTTSGTPLDLAVFRNKTQIFLGVKVGADAEAVPRLQLATTLFANVANYCGDAQTFAGKLPSDFASASHQHPWSDLTDVPAGFADGVDNDTQYSAASRGGLALGTDNAFSVDPTALNGSAPANTHWSILIPAVDITSASQTSPAALTMTTITTARAGAALVVASMTFDCAFTASATSADNCGGSVTIDTAVRAQTISPIMQAGTTFPGASVNVSTSAVIPIPAAGSYDIYALGWGGGTANFDKFFYKLATVSAIFIPY